MTTYFSPEEECLARGDLERLQLDKFRALADTLSENRFYSAKFASAGVDPSAIHDLDGFSELPLTSKSELTADQEAHPPYGTNLSLPVSAYTRIHRTSGTTGTHLRWLDTPESWQWIMHCWGIIYGAAGIGSDDRIFFPFSFGPFIGLWAAFESAAARGNFVIPGGGMSTSARINFLITHDATVVCCTPTYALRMAQTAVDDGIDLTGSPVRALIVAGEPGGNIPEVRGQIESGWGARVFDHTGMTEAGSLGI
jgi:phenylacetate-CoA ligase